MNVKRVVLGGLLAGLFINVSEALLNGLVLMEDYQAMMADHGLTEASWAIPAYVTGGFVFGLALAWLYAAIRPRFGPGPKTGAIAGVLLFVVGYVVPGTWFATMGLTLDAGMMVLALVWGLAELVAAGVIAGWIYREDAGQHARPADAVSVAGVR